MLVRFRGQKYLHLRIRGGGCGQFSQHGSGSETSKYCA